VERLIPSSLAIEVIECSGWASSARGLHQLRCHRRWPAEPHAAGLRRGKPFMGAFENEFANELGERREHVEHQPAARGRVSIASRSGWNPTPRRRRSATIEIRSCSDRASRSDSAPRARRRAAGSPGRLAGWAGRCRGGLLIGEHLAAPGRFHGEELPVEQLATGRHPAVADQGDRALPARPRAGPGGRWAR
jgi:hypothetical protein